MDDALNEVIAQAFDSFADKVRPDNYDHLNDDVYTALVRVSDAAERIASNYRDKVKQGDTN